MSWWLMVFRGIDDAAGYFARVDCRSLQKRKIGPRRTRRTRRKQGFIAMSRKTLEASTWTRSGFTGPCRPWVCTQEKLLGVVGLFAPFW